MRHSSRWRREETVSWHTHQWWPASDWSSRTRWGWPQGRPSQRPSRPFQGRPASQPPRDLPWCHSPSAYRWCASVSPPVHQCQGYIDLTVITIAIHPNDNLNPNPTVTLGLCRHTHSNSRRVWGEDEVGCIGVRGRRGRGEMVGWRHKMLRLQLLLLLLLARFQPIGQVADQWEFDKRQEDIEVARDQVHINTLHVRDLGQCCVGAWRHRCHGEHTGDAKGYSGRWRINVQPEADPWYDDNETGRDVDEDDVVTLVTREVELTYEPRVVTCIHTHTLFITSRDRPHAANQMSS